MGGLHLSGDIQTGAIEMVSMTPLYDGMVATQASEWGTTPAWPRHPDIYQQLCREFGDVHAGRAELFDAVAPDLLVEPGAADGTPSGYAGWFAA